MSRGQVIASCGALGLDWTATALGEFLEAVEAHNDTGQPDTPEPATPEFRDFMKGRFKQG